jgi:hypothetical protein
MPSQVFFVVRISKCFGPFGDLIFRFDLCADDLGSLSICTSSARESGDDRELSTDASKAEQERP